MGNGSIIILIPRLVRSNKLTAKGAKDYFKAPHATIYPDKIVVDEGGQTTRCPAVEHDPCLLITAKTFEIYPKEK